MLSWFRRRKYKKALKGFYHEGLDYVQFLAILRTPTEGEVHPPWCRRHAAC